ncbi:MAG: hypothetical protein IKK74_00745 [Clostridia bacterium]|nr:hypothetical protein [Clostridia bacterium]
MKKTLCIPLILAFLLLTFVSCGPDYRFKAKYPEGYTAGYFHANYVQADPNLIHLYASENSAGKYDEFGQIDRYYAIKDVPIDEYVCYSHDWFILDPGFEVYIARNKDMKISGSEILSYEVSSAELFWEDGSYFDDKERNKMEAIGEKKYYESVASIDAKAFQNALKDCIETGNYVGYRDLDSSSLYKPFVDHEGVNSYLTLKIRVRFSKYENIVWDATVKRSMEEPDKYYVVHQLFVTTENFPEGYYTDVCVPLDSSIAKLIPAIN